MTDRNKITWTARCAIRCHDNLCDKSNLRLLAKLFKCLPLASIERRNQDLCRAESSVNGRRAALVAYDRLSASAKAIFDGEMSIQPALLGLNLGCDHLGGCKSSILSKPDHDRVRGELVSVAGFRSPSALQEPGSVVCNYTWPAIRVCPTLQAQESLFTPSTSRADAPSRWSLGPIT